MKNLKLLFSANKKINVFNSKFLIPDPINKDVIYVCTESKIFEAQSGVLKEIFNTSSDIIVSCEYLSLGNEICLATQSGSVFVFNLTTRQQPEEVTFCEGGIEKMAWSPDQEVVAFITSSKNVVVMSCHYDPIIESSLDDTFFGDQLFITVGWGKKETQFHGSAGKQAAKVKENFTVPEDLHQLDQTVAITWRNDGFFFAVSYVGVNGRMFKVFDKEGRLQSTSENASGLGAQIAWRPTGTWIAVSQQLPNKYTIALFEKNGLRHREIVLPFKFEDEQIVGLTWSGDSDIISIETENNGKSQVYLYTMTNYHWYLKQFLKFEEQVTSLMWDCSENKTLYVMLKNGTLLLYRWDFTISHSYGDTIENQSIVAVIDGNRLLLTDFRNRIVPPPMSSYVIERKDPINFVGFLKDTQNVNRINQLFTVDAGNKLVLYELSFEAKHNGKLLKGSKCITEIVIEDELFSFPLALHHWLWLNELNIVFCKQGTEPNLENTTIYVGNTRQDAQKLEIIDKINIKERIGFITEINSNKLLVHAVNGKIYTINMANEFLHFKCGLELNDFCENIKAIEMNGNLKIFSHKNKQSLYVNDQIISSDVTSFFLTEKYLVFTLLNSMKFMRLEDNAIVDERQIERGGKIVAIIPKDSRTVLQMPRGNLEVIQPRVLSLTIVGEFLDQSEYKKAMEILRKQRINLNIIVDHNPEKFFKEIDRFLDEISSPNWLNLFLTDLHNEDFTKTMYASNYLNDVSHYPVYYCIESKVKFICDQMCQKMIAKDHKAFILPIITSFVKKNEIEKALEIVWTQKKKESLHLKDEISSEDALKFLLYLVDVNELYNVALGMYDFGLVLFVANKSQKDPKEYIPFLNELKKLESNYCKFKIDEYLKRYEHALENIAKCGEERFTECLEFVERHKLYTKALMEFEAKEDFYKKIAISFADYLRAQGKLESASVMYERGGDLQQAIMSAKHVVNWQRCINLTKRLTQGAKEEMENISLALMPALEENGKYKEAAYLIETYCNDLKQAISILMKGRLYLDAIFEANMHDPSLIEAIIKPNLEAYKDLLQGTFETDKEHYLKLKERLQIVRKEKEIRFKKNQQTEEGIDESDLLSETSSVNSSKYTGSSGTGSTGKTFRSSKNRRKFERKLHSLKEGSPYEDIAIIDTLWVLGQKIASQQPQIRDICKALIEVSYYRDARQIQNSFGDLLITVNDSLDDIWIPEMMPQPQTLGSCVDYVRIQNEQHYAMMKQIQRIKPQLVFIDWEHEILK